MNNLVFDKEKIYEVYNRLGNIIEQMKNVLADNEKADFELKEIWKSRKAQIYFNEAEILNKNIRKIILMYENVKEELYIKLQSLNNNDGQVGSNNGI